MPIVSQHFLIRSQQVTPKSRAIQKINMLDTSWSIYSVGKDYGAEGMIRLCSTLAVRFWATMEKKMRQMPHGIGTMPMMMVPTRQGVSLLLILLV